MGHGDRFIRTWLDLLALSFGSFNERIAAPVFKALSDPVAPGACGKCHTISNTADDRPKMNWSADGVTGAHTDFTVFSHVPHFSLAGGGQCASCHSPSSSPVGPAPDSVGDSSPVTSSFRDIDKELCSRCHVEGVAGEACTQCHGYHVGVERYAAPSTQPLEASVERTAAPTG